MEEDNDLLRRCVSHIKGSGLPDIMDAIFFNHRVPENMNVKPGKLRYPANMYIFFQNEAGDAPEWTERPEKEVLDKLVDKCNRILVRYISSRETMLYAQQGDLTQDQRDDHQRWKDQLSNMTSRKKECFVPIRNAVRCRAETHRAR